MISRITGLVTGNLGIKLLALLLAFVVYAHVYTEQEQEWRLRAPLRVSGLGKGLVLVQDPPEYAEIVARGRGKQLIKLRMTSAEIRVDLRGSGPGRVQRLLSPADVALPPGADVYVSEVVEPTIVTVEVDTLVQRDVPVELTLLGTPPDGLALSGPVRAVPQMVTVIAPSRVAQRVRITAEPLQLRDLDHLDDVTLEVRANREDVRFSPDQVGVAAEVVEVITRTLPAVAVAVTRLESGLQVRIEPDSARVSVRGPAPLVEGLEAGSVQVRLNLSALTPGRHFLSPEVDLPGSGLTVDAVHPLRFLVEVFAELRREP
jgi:hypothetical protein